ncbi:MAG TPA: ANTAR domain-containing protein [Clostridia bacterium]
MEKALIVSSVQKACDELSLVLQKMNISFIDTASSGAAARVMVLERDFDLCIINAPLKDELGSMLAQDIALNGTCQVILIVKAEIFEETAAKVEEAGVFCLSKPINQQMLWSVLRLAVAAYNKSLRMQRQNTELKSKLDDLKQVSRAKCLLIEKLNMSEQQAHRYIEKQAMDMRMTKIQVAKDIISKFGYQ